jgi:hypothetical protein
MLLAISRKSSRRLALLVLAVVTGLSLSLLAAPGGTAPAQAAPVITLTAKATDSAVTVGWTGVAEAASYRVHRDGTDLFGGGRWSAIDPASARSRTFLYLINGATYTFTVAALRSNGTVLARASITATPTSSPTVAPTPTPLPGGVQVGTQWHAVWSDQTDADRDREVQAMRDHRMQWVRIDVGWPMLQPSGPSSYSASGEAFVRAQIDRAKQAGMKVLVTFWLTPGWANGGQADRVPPTNPDDYGRALARYAALWPDVDGWEVWNEPDLAQFWQPSPDPARYAALLRSAYTNVKRANPNARVVVGGPEFVDTDWIGQLYNNGIHGYFDVMAVHPYMAPADLPPETDTGNQWSILHTTDLLALMESKGDGNKPVWFTEFGWSSHPNTGGEANWNRGVTEAQQADYLTRSLRLINQTWPGRVQVAIWYNSRQKNPSTNDIHQQGYGMMRRDFTPKPVLTATRNWVAAQSTP